MAGLSNFISNTATQSTTMPTWYDTAQQNVVNQATQGAQNVPSLQNTVAGQAINQLSGAQNPFTQAQGTLQQIGSGAANPWITDTSGNVTPNTSTALGGLFAAQNRQLQQTLPSFTAPVDAAAIGSGQFGSLRGETAYNKAIADAMATLNTQQMQAALQNQQTGVQAATGMGNVGSQGVTSMTNLGQAQQSDPLLAASALGKIIGGINAPTTVTNATQLSPLNQIGSIASALGGSVSGTDKLLQSLGVKGGLAGLFKGVTGGSSSSGGSSSGGTPGITYGTDQTTQDMVNSGATARDEEGNLMPGWQANADGSYSWTGNTDIGGTDYTNPGGDVAPDWSATESYD